MLVSVQQHVDLKNSNRNYKKNVFNFLCARIAAINLFQVDHDKHEITYDTVTKRHFRPLSLFQKDKG